jgi:hypothetical protein
VGSCSHILSRQAISVITSRDPDAGSAYPVTEASGWGDWMPGPPRVGEGEETSRHVVKSCPLMSNRSYSKF